VGTKKVKTREPVAKKIKQSYCCNFQAQGDKNEEISGLPKKTYCCQIKVSKAKEIPIKNTVAQDK